MKPKPIEHSFKCGRCGEHKVTQETFDAHVTPAVRDKIVQTPEVTKARLVFKGDGCPICLPQNTTHTRIADVQIAVAKRAPIIHIDPDVSK